MMEKEERKKISEKQRDPICPEETGHTVMTVRGPVPVSALGFCQCHEHLGISKGVSCQVNPVLLIDDEEKNIEEAARLVQNGGSTIVDAQPGGCCRMESLLLRVSQKTGLHIICSAGFHKLSFYPADHWLITHSGEEVSSFFLCELTEGMCAGIDEKFAPVPTDIRAGIVKMALDRENLTDTYGKLFRAGTRAALLADVPVMVHIEQGSDPFSLYEFLRAEGMRPGRIIFCHMDRAVGDLSIHKLLLREGIYLEYDTIGRFRYHSDERELEIFREMTDAGYERQLLFSLDTTRARLKAYDSNAVGLDYLQTVFVPKMRQAGFTDRQIRAISHDNFADVFTKEN